MTRFAIVVSAVLPLLASLPAAAQKLEPGKWTGTVIPPGEQAAVAVSYDVTVRGDTIGITIDAGEHGAFAANDVKVAEKTLTFWFAPGPRVECTLTLRDDGAFAGPCVDPDGGTASMMMAPPKKE